MRILSVLSGMILLMMSSCITIIDDPLVTMNPQLSFQAHVRSDIIYVDVKISANPAFINAGNVPTLFIYEGTVKLYDENSGDPIGTAEVSGEGLNTIVEVTTALSSYDDILIIATGEISAYADLESDGLTEDDRFILSSDYYEVENLVDVLDIQDYPVVTMEPSVDLQTYMLGTQLYTTATITANPNYINTTRFPLNFVYDGLVTIYDEVTGGIIKFKVIEGTGLSTAVTTATDTTNVDGLVIIVDGSIVCTGDIDADGDASNDITISTTDVYEMFFVDMRED